MSQGKLIVVTAPSGAGKTTIVHHLLDTFDNLAFSVSATTRHQRDNEQEGIDYYYTNVQEFKRLIEQDAFLEWQEVYENQFYGTLKSEVERLWGEGKHVIFDIDVKGAINVKNAYPDRALTIFIKPPSEDVLLERLKKRKSESAESLQKRIAKATFELTFEDKFDKVLVNDDLTVALKQADAIVGTWLDTTDN
ncbi:MAG: guanylate kinase [Saprospiraceae bacterium]|nr:guanylate kinase [Saprospiraceae bacterium]MCF8249548.1 guanylate kinase [Saprospiraceae bacterium]MCF8281298.1 guanylate kinase [Bacteroidales bacterium]MCF8310766.1 guanylate kinase [Saprospiraceae bacterium]MCF8439403.1 guanylate kinase [Saprospiraceae bacterium]